MTQKQNPQTNPVGKCKGKFKIYGLRETIRDIVHIKRYTELYTISHTHILSNVSDMQHDINCTRNKMTIGHNECSAPFLTHQMGNIYEQFMFLLRGLKIRTNPSTDATASTDRGEKKKGWECNGVGKK